MKKVSPCHFEDGIELLSNVLSQSHSNQELSKTELKAMSKTILFSQMMFLKDKTNMDDYYNIIIKKFL